jgi:hypothetical protein
MLLGRLSGGVATVCGIADVGTSDAVCIGRNRVESKERKMNTLLISFGDGIMMGRINWPIDGMVIAVALVAAFVLLLAALLREAKPANPTIRLKPLKPTGVRPVSGALHYPRTA